MLTINKRTIGSSYPVYVIAEIGINYNGSCQTALEMIEHISHTGADAVKVQIVTADKSYTKSSPSYSLFKQAELSLEDWKRITKKAKKLGLDIFSTFANADDLCYIRELGLPAVKISSTNVTNFPLLEEIAKTGKPVIISTGMGYLSEIDEAVRFLEEKGQTQIGILQCTSLYPTTPEDVNLNVLKTLSTAYPDYPVGFSDHTSGISCSVAAVALGAKIIEKHFTLDKKMAGPDHHFSASPDELKQLIVSIREVEKALGSPIKKPVSKEIPLRTTLQRSIIAARDIEIGEMITEDVIAIKRSNRIGILPKYLDFVIGRNSKKKVAKDQPITSDVI
jgi:N,N'-diacetyllegionaminate synthase